MIRSICLIGITCFLGCATPKGAITTPLYYFLPDKPATNATAPPTDAAADSAKREPSTIKDAPVQLEELNLKLDRLEKLIIDQNKFFAKEMQKNQTPQRAIAEHNLSVATVWSYVLNGERAGDVYRGLSLTGTIPNNLLSFKLMVTASKDYEESKNLEVMPMPAVLQTWVPMNVLATIREVRKVKDFVIMPGITLTVVHLKVLLGFFGSEPNVVTSVELRTGMAYDLYLHYTHTDYRVSFLEGPEKRLSLPSGISENGYASSLTTFNLDFAPLHFEANLILNSKECKMALGLGVIW